MKLSLFTSLALSTLVLSKPLSVTYREITYNYGDKSEINEWSHKNNQEPILRDNDNNDWLEGSGLPYLTGYLGAITDFTNNVTEGSKIAHIEWVNLLHKMAINTERVVLALKDEGPFDDTQGKEVVADFRPFKFISGHFFKAVLNKKSLYKEGSYSKKVVDNELSALDLQIRRHLTILVRLTLKTDSTKEIKEEVSTYSHSLAEFREEWGYYKAKNQ